MQDDHDGRVNRTHDVKDLLAIGSAMDPTLVLDDRDIGPGHHRSRLAYGLCCAVHQDPGDSTATVGSEGPVVDAHDIDAVTLGDQRALQGGAKVASLRPFLEPRAGRRVISSETRSSVNWPPRGSQPISTAGSRIH
jgi:hypothetical protein